MKNIAVLVSGGGTNLQALINAQKAGKIQNGQIVLVISSNASSYALVRAAENGIESLVISRKDFPSPKEFDTAILEALKAYEIDLVILAGYLSILSKRVTDAYQNRIINVHPALIPSFCGPGYYGLRVHQAVLESGVKLTGATVHFVNEVADGGAIILQKAVAVLEGDTPERLQKRVMEEAEWLLLPKAASLFCQGKIRVEGNRTVVETNRSDYDAICGAMQAWPNI